MVMANTYTQIHIHCVFSVQNRLSLIVEPWRDTLYRYITGIIQNNGHKLLSIGGMPDHIHLLFGMRPVQSLSELVQDIKGNSSGWINKQGYLMERFSWQEGYGAFSYSRSQLPKVIEYIKNQDRHHLSKTFLEEYKSILQSFGIEYDEHYIFKPIE